MENLEREVKNQRVHIDNLVKYTDLLTKRLEKVETYEPIIKIYSNRNLIGVFSVCVSVLSLLLMLLLK